MPAATTPFDLLGGEEGVDKLVWSFYERVLADPELAPFFAKSDMTRLLSMQREFLTTALGGPVSLTGAQLNAAHAGRGIRGRHYLRFLDHLLATLRSAGLNERDVDRVLDRMAIAASDILGDTTVTG